jgi:hypothetical protein
MLECLRSSSFFQGTGRVSRLKAPGPGSFLYNVEWHPALYMCQDLNKASRLPALIPVLTRRAFLRPLFMRCSFLVILFQFLAQR